MKPQMERLTAEVVSQELSSDEFLTTKELMALLKIKHRQTIYDLIDGGMPVILVGRNYRFIRNEVIYYLRTRSGTGGQ